MREPREVGEFAQLRRPAARAKRLLQPLGGRSGESIAGPRVHHDLDHRCVLTGESNGLAMRALHSDDPQVTAAVELGVCQTSDIEQEAGEEKKLQCNFARLDSRRKAECPEEP